MKPRNRNAGFTLHELMIALAVAAVLAAIAVPNTREFIQNSRLTAASNDLLRSVQIARSEAIKRQQRTLVCATNDPSATTPVCSSGEFKGWVVFQDTDNDAVRDADEVVLERHDLVDSTVTIVNDGDGMIGFGASGFSNTPSAKTVSRNIVICDVRGNQAFGTNASVARAVRLEATGRARVTKLKTDLDAAIGIAGACP